MFKTAFIHHYLTQMVTVRKLSASYMIYMVSLCNNRFSSHLSLTHYPEAECMRSMFKSVDTYTVLRTRTKIWN